MTWEIKKCSSHLIINNINKHDASALECRIVSSSFARNKLSSHFDNNCNKHSKWNTQFHESNNSEFISQRYLKRKKSYYIHRNNNFISYNKMWKKMSEN